jgi:PmbA protein
VEAAARRGADQRTGAYSDWALGPARLDPERVGRTGARRAVESLGARRGPTGVLPVVLDPESAAALLEALSPAFSGLRALRGRTVLQHKLGQKIGAPRVTLVDDATLPGIWGATPVDGEGWPTRRLVLVAEGELRRFITDFFTARRRGEMSTGHALRGGYSVPPAIGVHGLHLSPTGETRPELLARAAGGLLVTNLMGLHTVNPTTGEFSLGAAGREILAGGELGQPLDQFAIAGSILRFFESIAAVADDLEFFVGSAGGASVLLADTPVSGA